MSKRGLSVEEKADRAVAFFHETASSFSAASDDAHPRQQKSYFTMKDLQKASRHVCKDPADTSHSCSQRRKASSRRASKRSSSRASTKDAPGPKRLAPSTWSVRRSSLSTRAERAQYWSFPSQAAADARSTLAKADKENEGVKQRQHVVESAIEQARVGRHETVRSSRVFVTTAHSL